MSQLSVVVTCMDGRCEARTKKSCEGSGVRRGFFAGWVGANIKISFECPDEVELEAVSASF